ncbi:hypothetical protein D9M68_326170 [compost metagenome]
MHIRHRPLDELRLAAVAVRRHDQAASHAVGRLAAEIAADQMQAEVNAGGTAGRRQHLPAIDIEHIGHHLDVRI